MMGSQTRSQIRLGAAAAVLAAGVALSGGVGCEPFEPEGDETGCCYYSCSGGRTFFFGTFFGNEQICAELAAERCVLSSTVSQDLTNLLWIPGTPANMQNLRETCESIAPPFLQ